MAGLQEKNNEMTFDDLRRYNISTRLLRAKIWLSSFLGYRRPPLSEKLNKGLKSIRIFMKRLSEQQNELEVGKKGPRDDFSDETKRVLALRVGYLCSNPKCRKATTGPQQDPTKAINIGVAAHITAAAPGGPRYDATLTPEQRRYAGNGIWACQSCGKLIDNDKKRYTTETLVQWKQEAEAEALERLEKSGFPLNLFTELERLDEYNTVPEVAAKLGVKDETIYRWGMTDKIRFAIIRHDPANYDDIRYETDEDGDEITVTTEYRTIVLVGSKHKRPIEVFYLKPEDIVSIVRNKIEARMIRIHRLFETMDLNPKQGKLLVNCPIAVTRDDLIVTREAFDAFVEENLQDIA